MALNLSGLLLGFWRHPCLAARAVVHDGPWVDRMRALAAVPPPVRLLRSDQPALLVTWGFFTQGDVALGCLVLGARSGSSCSRTNSRTFDGVTGLSDRQRALRIVYWFNPLMWLASARLRL